MDFFWVAFKLTMGYAAASIAFLLIIGAVVGVIYLAILVYYKLARKL